MRSLRARAHTRAPFTDQAVYVYQGILVAIAFKRSSRTRGPSIKFCRPDTAGAVRDEHRLLEGLEPGIQQAS
jgi:hypothetical protein